MSERNNNSSEGQPGHPASPTLHTHWLSLYRKSAQIFCYDQEAGGGGLCWTCATFTCFWRNIIIVFNRLTYLFPRAFWPEGWPSRGAWESAAHPDDGMSAGTHWCLPISLPFSLTLLARAAVPGSAGSRGTWVPSCLLALHSDTSGSCSPSSLRCCALKNGCILSAHNLVILMSSNPKQETFLN